MNPKAQTAFLRFLVGLVILALAAAVYAFIVLIPEQATADFGAPHPALDRSQTLILSAKLFFKRESLLTESVFRQNDRIFIISPGATGNEIAAALEKDGWITRADSLADYLIYKGMDRSLQSGTYQLPEMISPKGIADLLVDQNPDDVVFAFPAGWRVEEIAMLLPSSGLQIEPQAFIDYVKNPSVAALDGVPSPSSAGLEGFLFPGYYHILRSVTLRDFVAVFTGAFTENLPPDFEEMVGEKGLTISEAVILASLVEKEAILPEEGARIAGVFLNRLRLGMPLQSDPSVQYALGYQAEAGGWWKNPLSAADLQVDSAYNTYRNTGLPPGPICNPGLNALVSVAQAEVTDFLYFRSACDGSGRHTFSRTYEEHLSSSCE